MTLDQATEKKIYDKLRAFDGLEVAGHEPVDASIASVLSEGEVLGDDGNQYSSIQEAVDNSQSWVFAGPGTYYENIVIDQDDFMLQGAGHGTLIDAGTVDNAIEINGHNCTVSTLKCKNDRIAITGDHATVQMCHIGESGAGIETLGNNAVLNSNTIENSSYGYSVNGDGCIVTNNTCTNSTQYGIRVYGSDCILGNNIIDGTTDYDGIRLQKGADNIAIGNRILNIARYGIRLYNTTDNIIANNRVSSSDSAINNGGTGTVTDGNLTGAAN